MQINFFAYDPDKRPSWPLAWQSWLLSLAAMLPLGHLYPRICCWKLLSCILNSCKMQSKPMPVSGRRDPTAPWLGELGETSPFPSWPKKPMHCQHNLWGAADQAMSAGWFLQDALCTATREEVGGNFLFLTNFCRVSYHFGNFLSHESEWVAQLLLSCVQR